MEESSAVCQLRVRNVEIIKTDRNVVTSYFVKVLKVVFGIENQIKLFTSGGKWWVNKKLPSTSFQSVKSRYYQLLSVTISYYQLLSVT